MPLISINSKPPNSEVISVGAAKNFQVSINKKMPFVSIDSNFCRFKTFKQ